MVTWILETSSEPELLIENGIAKADVLKNKKLQNNKRTVVHRVVAVGGELTTRGDSLPTVDNETIKPRQFIGKVVRIYRLGRSISTWGGIVGRVAGTFYHYAGRVDPQRTSRGGKLAMRIRSLITPCLRVCHSTGRTRVLKRAEEPDMTIWKFGNIAVGRKDPLTREWLITWPWNIILQHPGQL